MCVTAHAMAMDALGEAYGSDSGPVAIKHSLLRALSIEVKPSPKKAAPTPKKQKLSHAPHSLHLERTESSTTDVMSSSAGSYHGSVMASSNRSEIAPAVLAAATAAAVGWDAAPQERIMGWPGGYLAGYPQPNPFPINSDENHFAELEEQIRIGAEVQVVLRPNHGLAHAVRKAVLVPYVVAAYQGSSSYNFNEDEIVMMQIGMIFSASGRCSEVSHTDDPGAYSAYKGESTRIYNEYVVSKMPAPKPPEHIVLEVADAIASMHRKDTQMRRVLSMCHNLDLLRVYRVSLKTLSDDIGQTASAALIERAEKAILATGNRLMYSHSDLPCDGYSSSFVECSKDASACFRAAMTLQEPPSTSRIAVPRVEQAGQVLEMVRLDGCVARFCSTRYLLMHDAVRRRWDATKWDRSQNVDQQKQDVQNAAERLIEVYCRLKNVPEADMRGFRRRLFTQSLVDEPKIELLAERLWISDEVLRIGDGPSSEREFCSILNEAIRSEGHGDGLTETEGDDLAAPGPMLEPATIVACMLELGLTSARRGYVANLWPMGVGVTRYDQGRSTEADTTFRGSGIPQDFLPFFRIMHERYQSNSIDGWYRVPFPLASSFQDATAQRVGIERAEGRLDPSGKVVDLVMWRIQMDARRRCKHANFLTNNVTEFEFLFAAYSCFQVRSIAFNPFPTLPYYSMVGSGTPPASAPEAPGHRS
jgi:hypothetical protein